MSKPTETEWATDANGNPLSTSTPSELDRIMDGVIEKCLQALTQASKGIDPYYDIKAEKEAAKAQLIQLMEGVIGEDEPHIHDRFCNSPCNNDGWEEARNALRAEQRVDLKDLVGEK